MTLQYIFFKWQALPNDRTVLQGKEWGGGGAFITNTFIDRLVTTSGPTNSLNPFKYLKALPQKGESLKKISCFLSAVLFSSFYKAYSQQNNTK